MKKSTEISGSPFSSSSFLKPIIFILLISIFLPANANNAWWEGARPEVKRANERISLLKTEDGEISAVDFNDGSRFGPYHLQFITLEPNSIFLPVLLHADMVFYIHTGSGRLNWIDDGVLREVELRRGDVYRLSPGSILYLQSSLETEREKLRIYALFSSTDDDSFDPAIGAYSSVTDLVRGFDKKVLSEAFMAPEEVIDEIMSAEKPPLIVHAVATQSRKPSSSLLPSSFPWELEARFLKGFLGVGESGRELNKNKKKKKGIYNVYEAEPDFENCNGWSLTVTKKASHQLKGSNIGMFIVNLTTGSMMGPHWNPRAWEIGIVTSDEPGVVRVGCSSTEMKGNGTCENWSFVVGKGDVFIVPKFHPMTQMSFNNGSFVFVGFSTSNKHNAAQFFAGGSSVFQVMDRKVLGWSFNVNETTIDRLLGAQVESVILECTSCAEEEVRKMEEEAERERQEEEERKRKEEERKRREEEEERKREEEERKREEEERKRREEEERERKEEEEERERKEEEEREREEEERKRKERKEEEEREREEEERKRKEEEEREREEERKREEEEARKEEEMRRKEEEERKREEERERREEEEAEREEEEARERWRRQREAEREAEEEQKRGREEEEEERVIRILTQWT